jgi:hypothetical protein
MKRTALTGLFLTAALLASPAFAEDLCSANLAAIKNQIVSGDTTPAVKTQLEETQKEAMKAQANGDNKKCTELTTKAVNDANKSDSGGGEGGAK